LQTLRTWTWIERCSISSDDVDNARAAVAAGAAGTAGTAGAAGAAGTDGTDGAAGAAVAGVAAGGTVTAEAADAADAAEAADAHAPEATGAIGAAFIIERGACTPEGSGKLLEKSEEHALRIRIAWHFWISGARPGGRGDIAYEAQLSCDGCAGGTGRINCLASRISRAQADNEGGELHASKHVLFLG